MEPNAIDRSSWDDYGLLVLRSALSASQVADLDDWVGHVEDWSRHDGPGLHHFEQTPDGARVARSEDFDPHHPELSKFIRGGIVADTLASLFGEPAVLFKEKVNYKYPGGGGFAPHQDATAYRFIDHHISVMVPLDPSTIESGCLYFAAGHTEGVLPNEAGRTDETWVSAAEWFPVETQPGDVVFFDSYAPHYSETNRSSRARRAMYLTYNAASAGDHRDRYYADKQRLLEASGGAGDLGGVVISVNDDFLGRPVDAGGS